MALKTPFNPWQPGPGYSPIAVAPITGPLARPIPKAQRRRVLGVMKKGGNIKKTGDYKLHKGERVLSRSAVSRLETRAKVL